MLDLGNGISFSSTLSGTAESAVVGRSGALSTVVIVQIVLLSHSLPMLQSDSLDGGVAK